MPLLPAAMSTPHRLGLRLAGNRKPSSRPAVQRPKAVVLLRSSRPLHSMWCYALALSWS